jgi:hypothetical protein
MYRSQPKRPPFRPQWQDFEDFKPATVVDYGHQDTNITTAPILTSHVSVPALVSTAPSKIGFQEPLQTFDYGHGRAANTTRNTERDPDSYNAGKNF